MKFLWALFLVPVASFAGDIVKVHCQDVMSFSAGQIVVEPNNETVKVKLRTAGFYPARVSDLAKSLGLQLDENQMPLWAEVEFPADKCQQSLDPLLLSCSSNTTTVVFKDFMGGKTLGSVKGPSHFKIDALDRQSLEHIHPDSARTEASLIVSNQHAYRKAAIAEMAQQDCRID